MVSDSLTGFGYGISPGEYEDHVMDYLQPYYTVIALILIALVVLVGAAMILRSFNGRVRGRRGSRLGITEYYEMDQTRRLVLIRRDDVEHLMLVGGPQDVVIESNIPSAASVQPQIPAPPEPPQLRSARAPPSSEPRARRSVRWRRTSRTPTPKGHHYRNACPRSPATRSNPRFGAP